MLQIITSRPAIISLSNDRTHIGSWVNAMVKNGDIESIVDPRLRGDFDINSVWKAVEVSLACVSSSANKRPNMSQMVSELKECLAVEQNRRTASRVTDSTTSIEALSITMHTDLNPLAR
jgi:hypothetical protein